jgi:branched-chain amino acid transport system permease protein
MKKHWLTGKNLGFAIFFLFLLVIPLFVNNYQLRIFIQSAIFMIFAMSLNLLMGIGGTVSFGHAAFYGIGSYTSILCLTRLGLTFTQSLPIVILVSGLAGLLLALPMSRVTGRYVTIVTLSFCEITNLVMKNWESLTRGTMGIMNIPNATLFGYQLTSKTQLYYVVLAFVLITYIIIAWTVDSKLGRNLKAMRDDALAAEAMGIHIFSCKVFVFCLSAIFAGIAGALYGYYMGYIDPTCFTTNQSFTCISIVVVGGLGNFLGTCIASLFLIALPEYLRNFEFLFNYRMIVYGVILVLVMWLDHSLPGARFKQGLKNRLVGLKERITHHSSGPKLEGE